MKQIEVPMNNGEVRIVQIDHFSAMEGWEIQHRFLEFAASTDKDIRRKYTFEVLAHAKIVLGDREIPLATDAVVDNHLQTWRNVQMVFEAVLEYNGIDPKTHADNPGYWVKAGDEMALAFIASMSGMMGPAMGELLARQQAQAAEG